MTSKTNNNAENKGNIKIKNMKKKKEYRKQRRQLHNGLQKKQNLMCRRRVQSPVKHLRRFLRKYLTAKSH